jgi:hypothetical protein
MKARYPLSILAVALLGACDEETPASGPGITCGSNTRLVDGACVATPECGAGSTLTEDGQCEPLASLEPGHFSSPLAMLQRFQGEEDHMHIAQVKYRELDDRLFYCSYTFGVIDASNPQDMEYLVQGLKHETPSGSPRDPGCLHMAFDDDDRDLVFTTHRGNIDFAPFLSGWDLRSNPLMPSDNELDPQQLVALQEPGESYGGLDVENGLLYVALQENGLGIYSYDDENAFVRVATGTGFDNAWSVAVRGTTAYVADGIGGLAIADVSDPADVKILGRAVFGGNAEDLVIEGDVAYVAAGSAGMVIVDVSDPSAPTVLSAVPTLGSAVGVDVDSGRAYVAGWNDIRVVDVADPTAPSLIGAARMTINLDYEQCTGEGEEQVCGPDERRPDATARNLAVAAHGNYMFAGNWWVPYSFEVRPERNAPYMVLPEDVSLLDFGPTAVGQTSAVMLPVENHGNEPLTIYDAWIEGGGFHVSPLQARIEPGESATFTLRHTATSANERSAILNLRSDDPQQPLRQAYLVANQPGLGIGQPMPDTVATLLDGSTFSTAAEQEGKVMLLAYFATF